jgi:hypothetical protein
MGKAARKEFVMSQPPSSYDFVPLPDRAPLKFPGGAHVALIFTINIEYSIDAVYTVWIVQAQERTRT